MEKRQGVNNITKECILLLTHYLTMKDMKEFEKWIEDNTISSWKIIFDTNVFIEINYIKYGCTCGCNIYYPEKCNNGLPKKLEIHYKWFNYKSTSGIYKIYKKKDLCQWCKIYKDKYYLKYVKEILKSIERLGDIKNIIISYKIFSIHVVTDYYDRWFSFALKPKLSKAKL